jgi:hypothetical protein
MRPAVIRNFIKQWRWSAPAKKPSTPHCALRRCRARFADALWRSLLSTLLRIKRTLNGREIDQIILDVETRKALAIEHKRRADWRKSGWRQPVFRAKCEPLHAVRLTHHCPNKMPQSKNLVDLKVRRM